MQHLFEKGAGGIDRGLQRRLALRPLALLAGFLRHFHAGLTRQLLDRFGKGQALGLHGEADDVAMRATAETVEEALFLYDVEGRRLFLMERAEADIFAAASRQLHSPPDNLRQRHALT